ncbi:regulator of G protein signaling [Sistotremastrum niveocremeum HHB9708]|uniref:Regulator of G protein signaling n=1 Tax=Sistotremastrum niveocremeum HHB9708 TaxID=1314777 RepID=A0A164ZHP3_9AGAM|nr:regulator of G protein signaling [Sistotremastrum niveocremeum HHB9708]
MPGQNNGPLATTSHMMQTTKRGRPFLKDTLDLFATLITSLELATHRQFFKTYHNSFTTDQAAANLANLRFSQSNRGPDPREPARIVTTTTTTTFSMTRDMAKAMAQHFMDARLIENAIDPAVQIFKDRGVFYVTPKGLHVLERFITKNGITADHLTRLFTMQPICVKLMHLERRAEDDEIIVTTHVITNLFRRFVGRRPNYMPPELNPESTVFYHERAKGVPLMEHSERSIQQNRNHVQHYKHCFFAVQALEWLCDFTSVTGRDEAAEMCAHFSRLGFVELVSDKRKHNDSAIIFNAQGQTPNSPEGEFRCANKCVYRITDVGKRAVKWDNLDVKGVAHDSPASSTTNLQKRTERTSNESPSSDGHGAGTGDGRYASATGAANPLTAKALSEARIHRRVSMAENLNGQAPNGRALTQSNTDRLRYIIDEPTLRPLFRDFLKSNFCEENLTFYLNVQDFKRKFQITSSTQATSSPRQSNGDAGDVPSPSAMQRHHNLLINRLSKSTMRISLRPLVDYLNNIMAGLTQKAYVEPEHANNVNATQLQQMIKLYERIQNHVFRLMATDSLPKFIRTPKFLEARAQMEEYDGSGDEAYWPAAPPGLEEEGVGRTYMTVSQAANDQARLGLQHPTDP